MGRRGVKGKRTSMIITPAAAPAPAPATILIAIPLNDTAKSQELLSWAIGILAHPKDTIVALHILVGEEPKKLVPRTKEYTRFCQAKSFVISILGEFARLCRSKQVNLEARVSYSTSVGRGLIQAAEMISAEFLLLGGLITQSRRIRRSGQLTKYCFKRAPKSCSVVSIGNSRWPKQQQNPDFPPFEDSPALERNDSMKNSEKGSPRTVLHGAEDDSSSTGATTSICESPPPPPLVPKHSRNSQLKRVCSFFRSPFDFGGRERFDSSLSEERRQPSLRCFSYNEISYATKGFHPDNMVGQGGYSEVYRGDLSDGSSIAVKMLARDNANPKKEKEFLVELGVIGHVSHPNTASLIGYCIENGLYLIFRFSPNGNLYDALHGNKDSCLEWAVRYKIVLGVARGLHYLHKCCKHRIIHRDIKASNILLGLDYEPQITDFGLAKWLPNKWTHHAMVPIEGTFGYLAPEYFMHGIVDEKTDVFAFGILLLEIVTGRRPVDSSKESLLLWAGPLIKSWAIHELVDPRLEGNYDIDQMHKVVFTASHCVQQSCLSRPSMIEVLELLKDGHDSEALQSWRMPATSSNDNIDDYSMVLGYDIPTDIDLEDDVW